MKELKARLEKLKPLSSKVDSILIFNFESSPDANFFYFTNSEVNGIFYYDFSKPKLFTTQMEYERAKKSWIKEVVVAKFEQLTNGLKNKKIGVNKKRLSVELFQKLKAKAADISAHLENARMIKSQYEIRQIKQACRLAEKLWPKIESEISMKLTEHEMKGIIELAINKLGCEPSFSTIVAAGTNSRFPHHKPANAKLKEPIIIDFGLRHNGYCSDISRTIGSKKQKMLEQVIADTESIISPDAKASDIDNFVREKLGKEAKFFIHGLGHGIGVEVHEKPTISKNSKDVLKPGMVFTIEPGIYKNEGIRIENDYLLTEKKLVCLTR